MKKTKLLNILILIFIFGVLVYSSSRYNRNFQAAIPLVGDEPSYMVMADSIISFKTFNLKQEIKNQHWQTFCQQECLPHIISPTADKIFLKHGLGWPLILAPLFYFNDNPRLLAMFAQNIIVALLALNIFLWLKENKFSFWLSLFVSLVIIFSLPIVVQTYFLFSEPLAGLCLLYAIRKFAKPNIFSALSIAFLPWIHVKYLVFYPILLLTFFQDNSTKRIRFSLLKYRWFLLMIVFSILSLVIFNIYAYTSPFSGQEKISSFFRMFYGLLGVIVDREAGILAFAPFYLLGFFGLGILANQNRKLFFLLIYLIGSLWFLTGIFEGWAGGQAPPARMVLTILPLLALPLAIVLTLPLKWFFRIIFFLLAIPSLILGYVSRWNPIVIIDRPLFQGLGFIPTSLTLPIDLEKYFPISTSSTVLKLFWVLILIGLFISGILISSIEKNWRN